MSRSTMSLSTACLLVQCCFLLFKGSSTAGTRRESQVLNKWKRSHDAREETRHIFKTYRSRDGNFADSLVRIERAASPKRKGLTRQTSKKQMKRRRSKKGKVNRIHPLLKVKTPLDRNTLIDLLNDGVRKSQHVAFSTRTQLHSVDKDERQSNVNKALDKKRKNIDLAISTKTSQAANGYPASISNVQSFKPDSSEHPQETTSAMNAAPITRTQTTTHGHSNRHSTSGAKLQFTAINSSEMSQEATQTMENASNNRAQTTNQELDNRYPTPKVNMHSTPSDPSETPQEATPIGDKTPVIWTRTTTVNQKVKTPHVDNVMKPAYSNLSAVREKRVRASLGSSNPLARQRDSYVRAAASKLCNNTRDINTCMSSFSPRGLSSLRNAKTLNPRKDQGGKVDELKMQQVIMLTNLFNKSLSQTWRLLIPHPKLVTILQNQTNSEGIFDTQKEAETARSSSVSPELILTKLKKKKAKVYTASDHRPSAIGIGSVGALVLVAIIVGIIILDSRSLCRDLRRLKRSIYNLCKPVYKHKVTISKSTSNTKREKWAYVIHERQV